MTEALVAAACARGAGAVLNLQNDWECGRAIPRADAEFILGAPSDIYCLRLYGALKSRKGGKCGIHHGGREPRQVVEWKPLNLFPGYEVADIHWGHPPAITRIADAVALTAGATAESISRKRSGKMTKMTARVIENVFWHIGAERTPGFVA